MYTCIHIHKHKHKHIYIYIYIIYVFMLAPPRFHIVVMRIYVHVFINILFVKNRYLSDFLSLARLWLLHLGNVLA